MFNRSRSDTVQGVNASMIWQALKKKRSQTKSGSLTGISRSTSGQYVMRVSRPDLPENDELPDIFRIASGPCSRKDSNSDSITGSDIDQTFSSQSDLTSRRGVFSRKNYGSADMLNNAGDTEGMSNTAGAFRAELGAFEQNSKEEEGYVNSPIHVENPESQTRWYFKYFIGRMHQNYVGVDGDKEPFCLSVIQNDPTNPTQCRAILWRKKGSQKISIPCSSSNGKEKMSAKQVLSHFDVTKFDVTPKEVWAPEIQKDILTLEEQEGSMNYKFGVIYMRDGQTSDDAMYSNECGSQQFEKFVRILGDEVTLKGWEHFRGGLDNKNDTTGTHSIYTVFDGHEIMFHVSTMLPYTPENRQQVERKRHIGNDIVNIIFVDECAASPSWKPAMMKTHFTHIYAIVTFNEEKGTYRLNVFSQKSVPLFGPPLPIPTEFQPKEFREFLLVKLINGEKSAFHIPVFSQKREKTVEMLIKGILEQYNGESGKYPLLTRKSTGEMLSGDQAVFAKNKEDARQMEFLKLGQTLKLRTILNGDAPTSLITSSVMKREPWQPHPHMTEIPYEVLCGDSWGDRLIICTSKGTYLLEDENTKLLIDCSLLLQRISIVEIYNLLIALPERGNKSLYVIQLTRLDETDANPATGSVNPTDNSAITQQTSTLTHPAVVATASSSKEPLPSPPPLHSAVQSRSNSVAPLINQNASSANSTQPSTPPVNTAHLQYKYQLPRDRASLKGCKLDRTKGCSTYCLSKPFSSPLRLLVATGKRLLLFVWRSTIMNASSLSQWNQFQESNVESMFHFVREYTTAEPVELITIIDGPKGAVRFVTGYKSQFELVDEQTGDILQVYRVDSTVKANLISAIDICADYEAELLFTYNRTSRIQKMNDSSNAELEFKWNGEPLAVLCAFPYVLAFTADTIEIRLLINGNLVYTMALPNFRFITSKCDVYFATSAMLPSLSVVSVSSFASIINSQMLNQSLGSSNNCISTAALTASASTTASTLNTGLTSAMTSLATTPLSSTASSSGIWSDTRSPCLSTRERDLSSVCASPAVNAKMVTQSAAFRTNSGRTSSEGAGKEQLEQAPQKLTVYKIPLACLTLGNCSLEKMRTAVQVTSLPLSNTLSLTSQMSVFPSNACACECSDVK